MTGHQKLATACGYAGWALMAFGMLVPVLPAPKRRLSLAVANG